jgi:hypothetical protein
MMNSRPVGILRSGPAGANRRRTSRYRQAKYHEARRDGARTSEHLIVPVNWGNAGRADPGEGRGCLVAEPWAGTRARASYLGPLFP